MTLEFSRCVEDLVATRVFVTATDGLVDITALGQEAGGIVSLNARSIHLNSDNSFLAMSQLEGGGGAISLRAAGEGSAIVLTTPGAGKSALLSVSPDGLTLVYGPPANPGTIRMLDDAMVLSMGDKCGGSLITMTNEGITLRVGQASFTLTAEGLVSRCGEASLKLGSDGLSGSAKSGLGESGGLPLK